MRGGGDSGGTTIAVTSFPLQAGYQARIKAGSADNFTILGTCSGTATISTGAATASVFEGVSGFSATQTATVNLTNCTPATNAVSGVGYYDATYVPIGSSVLGVLYEKFVTAPAAIPTSVKVGDTAVVATTTVYADSSKAVVTGHRVLSYVVEADSANNAIVNLISKASNAANQPLFTQQSRFRIAADGTLSVLTIDIQYSTTSTNHLIWTKS